MQHGLGRGWLPRHVCLSRVVSSKGSKPHSLPSTLRWPGMRLFPGPDPALGGSAPPAWLHVPLALAPTKCRPCSGSLAHFPCASEPPSPSCAGPSSSGLSSGGASLGRPCASSLGGRDTSPQAGAFRNSFPRCCGGWKSKVKVSAGLAPSVAVRENLASPQAPGVAGGLWGSLAVAVPPRSLPSSSHDIPPDCVSCPSCPFL